MKKVIKILILIITLSMFTGVDAENYKIRELIPKDIKTNVLGEFFRYKGVVFDESTISFENVQNKTDVDRYLSVSIGLFYENKENIGTINYCEDSNKKLAKKDERKVSVTVDSSHISKKFKKSDIKYISIIGENENCRKNGELDYVGQTVEEIGMPKNKEIDNDSIMLFRVFMVIAGVLLFIFVYNFLFSSKYKNMDGEDVRQEYAYINKEKRIEREYNNRVNPPKPKPVIKNKTDEQREQEIKEAEGSGTSDLHNMYK